MPVELLCPPEHDEAPASPNDSETLYAFDVLLAGDQVGLSGYGGGLRYWNRKAEPVDFATWVRLTEVGDAEYGPTAMHYRVLARTRVGAYVVSTVWLGIDHGWGRGVPIIFESMVFAIEQWDSEDFGLTDLDMERYPTEDSAMEGHADMVTLVRLTAVQPPGVDATPTLEFPA